MNCNLCRYYNPNYEGCVLHIKVNGKCSDFSIDGEVTGEKEIISPAREIFLSNQEVYKGLVASIMSALGEIPSGMEKIDAAKMIADRIIGREER